MRSVRLLPLGVAMLLWNASPNFAFAQSTSESEQPFDLGISLILDTVYFNQLSEGNEEPAGFGHGHSHGHDDDHGHDHDHSFDEGFNLGHSELAFDARLGDVLDGSLMLGFDDDDIEVEEAYLTTRSLPAGLQLTAGKFLSEIGYVNSRHSHDWDFVERPLVNEFLFGHHGLQDTGLRATYTPATDWYTRLGFELLQGSGDEGIDRFDSDVPVERLDGPRIVTAFAKTGPDLGPDHALQIGASVGYIGQYARLEDHESHAHGFEGDVWFGGVDARYKYESGRNYGHGDWRITGEYFLARRDLDEYLELDGHGEGRLWQKRGNYTERQDGAYLEAVYGFLPRWDVGLRAEALGLTNRVIDFHPTAVSELDTSYRYSAQVAFRPIESVFLRGQLSYSDFAASSHDHDHDHDHGGNEGNGLAFYFQLNAAFGAHGAHRF